MIRSEGKVKVDQLPTRKNKKTSGNGNLPVIKCSRCDEEILLVPDAKLMGQAIEAHVEKHRSKAKTAAELKEVEEIRDDLITQVFDKAAQQ